MCIVFTCGEHTFRKEVEGYEGVICRCHNCGNYSGRVIKTHPWFTLCFVPILPLSIHGYEDVTCNICNYAQPLEHRQDVLAMKHGAGQIPMQPQGQQGQQGPPPNGGGYKPPLPGQQQGPPQQYQQQQPYQPQYQQQQPGQNGGMRYS